MVESDDLGDRTTFLSLIRDGRLHSTEPNKPDFSGMTVNERLITAGIMDQWDDAVRRRDRGRMIELLKQVEVPSADWTADTVLADPQKYGFSNNPNFMGMTIKERLVTTGIFNQWDDAVRRRDRGRMIELLKQVEVPSPDWTADNMLTDPQKYGF
jgi:hypothetical protein